ncbi:hypothetical protein GOP47_0018403 [Adiantum capillus-veneris]|uniref:Uncharacterized protein n=1 Tax=Adiantum capillus-veneris TaxID=13818 RepID=A0A9D4UD33_ADICA|nr:hypothetical protein GOP47_0018403 [Adiantum capillus-veneris]
MHSRAAARFKALCTALENYNFMIAKEIVLNVPEAVAMDNGLHEMTKMVENRVLNYNYEKAICVLTHKTV